MSIKLQWVVMVMVAACLVGCPAPTSDSNTAHNSSTDNTGAKAEATLSKVVLELPAKTVSPGGVVEGRLVFSMDPGWHTYTDPPGDSGMPPSIECSLPDGWTYELLPYPPAKTFTDTAGGTVYGYEDSVALTFRITAPATAKPGQSADITFSVQWLICKEICVPKSDTLQTTLTIAN